MVSLFQLGQRLRGGISGSSGLRGLSALAAYSEPWHPPQTCVIRGLSEDIFFPGEMLESLADHNAKFPLISKVPRGRLIEVDECQPTQINDHWRKLLFSGFCHSCICKAKGDCIDNAFDYTNVGVIKGLNVLGFRKLDRVQGTKNANHDEYHNFVEVLFSKLVPKEPSTLQQLIEWVGFLNSFGLKLPDDVLLHHPVFLEDEEMANLYVDIHRLARHDFPSRWQGQATSGILSHMESCFSNSSTCHACEKKGNILLRLLMGAHGGGKKALAFKVYKESPPPGTAVIDIHRIASLHCIEKDILARARVLYPGALRVLNSYPRVEVVRGLRYLFPLYPQEAAYSFKHENLWHRLRMKRRLPIPSIYGYGHLPLKIRDGP